MPKYFISLGDSKGPLGIVIVEAAEKPQVFIYPFYPEEEAPFVLNKFYTLAELEALEYHASAELSPEGQAQLRTFQL